MSSQRGQRSLPTMLREAEEHGRVVGRDDGVYLGRELGHLEGARLVMTALYRERFGPPPARVTEALDAMEALTELVRWNVAIGTRSKDEVDRLICGLDD
ncbi:hypothetical protein L6R52_18725 [Myxococcota bacterium]|nr:hypothetical protein [Myxococcota bacterium]